MKTFGNGSRWIWLLSFGFLTLGGPPLLQAQRLQSTQHNLSSSGPGPVKALTESRLCIFCHTPHRASSQIPLWNRTDAATNYLVYNSPTLISTPGQPTGSSRLCLSCHDGTIALGDLVSEPQQIQFQGGTVFLPPGHSLIGTDLSDDHPVSFVYDANLAAQNPELVMPSQLPPTLPLDHTGMLQCATCHDAHRDDYGSFLREPTVYSQLCVGCHQKDGWGASVHANSTAGWNGSGIDPWPHAAHLTTAENACQNCHQPHEAAGGALLLPSQQEENVCLVCHNGNVGTDIDGTLTAASTHPVANTTGVHQAGENPTTMSRHVECVDCHNPHAANTGSPPPPGLNGALSFVDGVSIDGNLLPAAASEMEICFKCHGDQHGNLSLVTRQINNLNTRQEFNPASMSFHPVATSGKNPDVPSLIPPLVESSMISCSDCHGNDGGQPAGPHGSQYRPLLKLNYSTLDNTNESPQAYALCYSCHDRNSILGDVSFGEHRKHVLKENVPCSACHDPHGIGAAQGTALNNSHLINFDTSLVSPDQNTGRMEFVDLGNRHGECYLTCHGERHSPESY